MTVFKLPDVVRTASHTAPVKGGLPITYRNRFVY